MFVKIFSDVFIVIDHKLLNYFKFLKFTYFRYENRIENMCTKNYKLKWIYESLGF